MATYGSARTLYRSLITNRATYHDSRKQAARLKMRELSRRVQSANVNEFGVGANPQEKQRDWTETYNLYYNNDWDGLVAKMETRQMIGEGRNISEEDHAIESGLQGKSMDEQFRMDTAMWYGACDNGSPEPRKVHVVRRLFLTMQRAGLWVRHASGGEWSQYKDDDIPLAAAISHGGRVLIQLPKATEGGHGYWNWLWGGNTAFKDTQRRAAATHGHDDLSTSKHQRLAINIQIQGFQGNIPPRTKYIKETGGALAGIKSRGDHYGINIGVGGMGNQNPYSGRVVNDGGEHGHLYIYYAPPTNDKHGAVLFGCEDSAPIDRYNPNASGGVKSLYLFVRAKKNRHWAPSQTTFNTELGRNVTGWCYGQTGHAHRVGDSGGYSVTGGMKWAGHVDGEEGTVCLPWHDNPVRGPGDKKDALFVDLAPPTIFQAMIGLDHYHFDNDTLGRTCNGVAYTPLMIRENPPAATA